VGARVALIERALMGGDCLNVGCVPSKALLKAAKIAHTVRAAGKFGVRVGGAVEVDFAAVMQRLRARRAHIARNDSAARYTKDLGVNVFIGDARFTSKYTVEVNGKTLRFIKAVIATGARAAVPPIPGIRDGQVPYLTNATVFNLTRLPPRVVVIGAGPIGLELAQAFARFGSQVTVLTRADRVLEKEDADAALVVQRALEADGVRFEMRVRFDRAELLRAAKEGDPTAIEGPAGLPLTRLHFAVGDREQRLECEALLVAVGRAANVEGLGLEAAGVEYSVRGVKVNDALQTSQKHIYAVGDAATKYQFTHMADFTARAVIRNALFFGKEKVSRMIVPWCTYTDPEVAHVGLYPADMQERGIRFTTFQKEFADNDRAVVEDATEGFVRVHVREGSDQILGATIVGPGAGDMINELTLAMHTKTGLGSLATVIHPYPTFAEAIRQCGDLYNRTRLTPTVKGLFRALMSFQR
jgi:pyruvate/2-oxoglutarate dehydrogenase complex dihydrolipoamide dehydrogenase (E3) component